MSDTTNTNDTPAVDAPAPKAANDDALVIDLTPVEVVVVRKPCACGCGEFPQRSSARFIPGHDAKLKSALIKAHLDGVETVRITDADGTRELSPLEHAEELDWDGFVIAAQRKRDREALARQQRKDEQARRVS